LRDFRRKPWRRKPEDQVSPETRRFVLARDGRCFLDRMHGSAHCCRDRFGVVHFPTELDKLTLDHVHLDGPVLGKRAKSDAAHLVAMCWWGNDKPPSHDERVAERDYLAALAQHEHVHVWQWSIHDAMEWCECGEMRPTLTEEEMEGAL
jgi:hypothetical protein